MQALQNHLLQTQENLKNKEVTGSSGNGLVSLTLNGEYELKDLRIQKECVDPDDIDGLEDLIKVAYRQAHEQLQKEESVDPSSLFNFLP